MELTPNEIKLSRFIVSKPEVVERLLLDYGYKLSRKVTLNELTAKTYTAILQDRNKAFEDALYNSMLNDGYATFEPISMGISAALSIGSAIFGSKQAKKQRDLQRRIVLAQLENDKLLGEEEIRVYGEVERTRILANTLQQYRSDLQTESTARQKNVYVYLIAIGLSISIIYGTTILIKD